MEEEEVSVFVITFGLSRAGIPSRRKYSFFFYRSFRMPFSAFFVWLDLVSGSEVLRALMRDPQTNSTQHVGRPVSKI